MVRREMTPERRRELAFEAGQEMIARCIRAVERGDIKSFIPIVHADDPETIINVELVR